MAMHAVTEVSIKSTDSESEVEVEVGHLEGDIIVPGFSNEESTPGEYNTLDEPIMSTVTRDLQAVGAKLYYALLPPLNKKNLLTKEWDLWGPLLLCTYIGLILQGMGGANGYQFTEIFALVWIGTACLTYHSVFVAGAAISVFQNICVLGYCLAPLAVAVSIFELMHLFDVGKNALFVRLLITLMCCAWASLSSTQILLTSTPDGRKFMVMCPVVLFYFLISSVIMYHSYVH